MTTETTSLAAWLLEQIEADELSLTLAAESGIVPQWSMTIHPHNGETIPLAIPALDPARVLAQCKAHRAIVERLTAMARKEPDDVYGDASAALSDTLRALAAMYADRPGFDEGWAL